MSVNVGGKKTPEHKEKQGQKRYKDFSKGQWWGRDDNEKENMVLERREL